MSQPKIAVVTGSRAEYGLLYWIIRDLFERDDCDLQLLVTGMHLEPEFGETWKQIEADGFPITRRIPMMAKGDDGVAMVKSVGFGTIGFADAFAELAPDVVLVLGDRFEILAAAQAASLMNIPVAHLHGGEVTEGAIDDAIRHCLTKLSRYHFVASEEAAKRVRQLGEQPDSITVTGAPGLDNIRRVPLMSVAEIGESLNFPLTQPYFLVTFHPVTAFEPAASLADLAVLQDALDKFPDHQLLITKANSDPAGREINAALDAYAAARPGRVCVVTSLGQKRYLSALQHCVAMVGNSSSGLFEAPAMKRPTVNIGDRQKGRPAASSVISCLPTPAAVEAALTQAKSPEFQAVAAAATSLYGEGGASEIAVGLLVEAARAGRLAPKKFYDLPGV